VAFVGAGVMAEAVIKGLLGKKLIDPARIRAADVRPERGRELAQRYGIAFTADNGAAVQGADVAVLSVKPQSLPEVLPGLKGRVPERALVLSIIAGAKISVLSGALDHAAVVRSMPNTPAQIGEGMAVWTASESVTDAQRAQAREILGALGLEVYVEEEGFLDAATAVSGSGPAYVFLFMEALVDAGTALGFSPSVSKQLVLQTVKGSVAYAMNSPLDLAQLRRQVTSPGGTTAAALGSFEGDGFGDVVSRAVHAAYHRSIELGKAKPREAAGKE
jgi:pyrroline-5-carboxylate reductase